MPPCFTVTGGQDFAELAGVRKDVCRESWDRALQNLPVSARICAGNPGTELCRACRCPQGCVPGIRGQGFAEFAGVRRMCAGNPGTGLYELNQKV